MTKSPWFPVASIQWFRRGAVLAPEGEVSFAEGN